MRPRTLLVFWIVGTVLTGLAHAQGFAALVSPPRFELSAAAGKTARGVIEVSNRSTTTARYLVRTADWNLSRDYGVTFQDVLQPGSCRPWVAIERPEVVVPGGGTMRYRFEVEVPAGTAPTECRFAILIEGAEPSIARTRGADLPVTGRIGVMVYVAVANAAPELELFGPGIATLNGRRLPVLRVHNSGKSHTRITGFLTGTDTNGISYDFTPTDFPILPGGEWDVFLTPSTATDDHPNLSFPVTVKGTLEWGHRSLELDQRFE
jgi:hypothetical protein